MTPEEPSVESIDRWAVGRAFGRASQSYDSAARVQALARDELISRLSHFNLKPKVVLDLGAGTGLASVALRTHFPEANILSVDLALPMLQHARSKPRQHESVWQRLRRAVGVKSPSSDWVAADAANLPLASGSVQLVFSNLMLQWCLPPDKVLAEVGRVLAPDGLFLFSTFGPTTLQELRAAWAMVDDQPHVNDFIDIHDLGSAMTRAELAEPVLDLDRIVVDYAATRDLLDELKDLGAGNSLRDRRCGLTGKNRLATMISIYRDRYANRATWEVIYGSAFASRSNARSRSGADSSSSRNEVSIPIGAIKRKSP